MDVIYSYSRKDAISDGVLIDITKTANEAGIILPTAITDTAWSDCVEWDESDSDRKQVPQDTDGRLWDVVSMAYYAIRNAKERSSILFSLYRVPRYGKARTAQKVSLKIVIGPGDNGEPVLTIMMPGED